jgi:hypothetical protein
MAANSRLSTGSTTSMGCRARRLAAALILLLLAIAFTAASGAAAPPPIGIVTGQDAGWPDVRGWSCSGGQALQIAPWGYNPIAFAPYSTYQYGVRVAVGDVNGDGKADIVTAPAKGAWTKLRVFDGTKFKQIGELLPFKDAAWWNGAFVATGDTNGDGRAEIIDGLDAGCCTTIHVLDAATGAETGGFFPYCNNRQTGTRITSADLNDDGKAEILAVPLGSSRVSAFGAGGGDPFRTYQTFGGEAADGATIATGDVVGDSRPELVAAANTPSGVQVKVIDTQSGATLASLFPYGAAAAATPQVAVGDVNGDGRRDIVLLTQLADGTQVRALDADGHQLGSFYVLETGIVPGASLAAGDLNGDGKAEIVIGGGAHTDGALAAALERPRPASSRLPAERHARRRLQRLPGPVPGWRAGCARRRRAQRPARHDHGTGTRHGAGDRDLQPAVAERPGPRDAARPLSRLRKFVYGWCQRGRRRLVWQPGDRRRPRTR